MDLPRELIEKILLQLSPRDIASFCLSFDEFLYVLTTKSFMKKHIQRFAEISKSCGGMNDVITYTKDMDFNCRCLKMKFCKKRSISNHCVNCILHPILLTIKPWKVGCFCVDHVTIWFGKQTMALMESCGTCGTSGCYDFKRYLSLGELLADSDSESDDDCFRDFDLTQI